MQISTQKVTIKEDVIDNITPLRKEDKKETNLSNQTIPKINRPSSSNVSGSSEIKTKLTNDVNKTKKPCNCTRSQCLKLYAILLIFIE